MKNIIYRVTKEKTNVRGFWQDEAGKVYIDNIIQVKYSYKIKQELFKSGELAVFYVNSDGQGIIEDKSGDITVLKDKISIKFVALTGKIVRDFLRVYGGCTIYRLHTGYVLEAWH